jgi:hypothetical protein
MERRAGTPTPGLLQFEQFLLAASPVRTCPYGTGPGACPLTCPRGTSPVRSAGFPGNERTPYDHLLEHITRCRGLRHTSADTSLRASSAVPMSSRASRTAVPPGLRGRDARRERSVRQPWWREGIATASRRVLEATPPFCLTRSSGRDPRDHDADRANARAPGRAHPSMTLWTLDTIGCPGSAPSALMIGTSVSPNASNDS